ncbi:hypothetical protein LTR97_011480 [Elasticomyces elasticus]|uniref:Terpene synthase n=1 Tax=Elasticomyces elasticus TaxID=574655 RepID=A0AAN7ZL17_9PEZI|nr:hypothetical protein LTR97_011480 [Elasticomyces elasticus]
MQSIVQPLHSPKDHFPVPKQKSWPPKLRAPTIANLCSVLPITNAEIPPHNHLAEAWQDDESIQSIITSWAGLDRHRAFTLSSQPLKESSSKSFSYHNKTLDETCHITLTHDDESRPVASGSIVTTTDTHLLNDIAVQTFVSDFTTRLPPCTRGVSKSADPWVFVDLFLPPHRCTLVVRVLGACFWIWLCIIDDLTEESDESGDLDACLEVLAKSPFGVGPACQEAITPALEVMDAFRNVVRSVRAEDLKLLISDEDRCGEEAWKLHLWAEVHTCCQALKAEQSFHGRKITMREWMAQRIITTSTRPFMVLFRAQLGFPTDLTVSLTPGSEKLGQLQLLLQAVLGLQNDVLGWEKDHQEQNPLNAIEVLISGGEHKPRAFHRVMDAHNDLMQVYLSLAAEYLAEIEGPEMAQTRRYVAFMTSCGHAMAGWMISCGRYIPDGAVLQVA